MLGYGDALQAFRNTFKTDQLIEGYPREFIACWCYGWLTAKSVCCSWPNLFDKIQNTDQIKVD